jgi:cysteine desulfurase / selenocysteine lyase
MYAPFGAGALVGRRTVEIVTPDEVHWAGLPDREEAGSPNVIGAIAMAAAARTLMDMGWEELERHEALLTQYALERLQSVRGVKIYGERKCVQGGDRVGVIPFNVGSTHHTLVAAILASEAAIDVRSGCFCAQQYAARLLRLTPAEQAARRRDGRIARDDYQGRYCQAAGTGEYCAAGVDEPASASYAALMRPRLSEMRLRSSAQ